MTIDEKIFDRYTLLTPRSDFWSTGGWELYDKVKDAMLQGKLYVVVNLAQIDRINSLGIGVLVACLKSLRDNGGDLKIAGPNAQVISVLQIVNLYTLMSITATVEEAVSTIPAA